MPVQEPHWSRRQTLSGKNVLIVLGYLCEKANAAGNVTASYREMDRDIGINAGHIGKLIAELEEKQFISIDRARDGRNVYTLLHARQRAGQLDQRAGSPSPVVVTPAGRNAGLPSETAAFSSPDIDPAQRPIIHVM